MDWHIWNPCHGELDRRTWWICTCLSFLESLDFCSFLLGSYTHHSLRNSFFFWFQPLHAIIQFFAKTIFPLIIPYWSWSVPIQNYCLRYPLFGIFFVGPARPVLVAMAFRILWFCLGWIILSTRFKCSERSGYCTLSFLSLGSLCISSGSFHRRKMKPLV